MASCIGCGLTLDGARCGACGTPATGAVMREHVRVPAVVAAIPVCACCLGPGEVEQPHYHHKRLVARTYLCRGCARGARWAAGAYLLAFVAVVSIESLIWTIAGLGTPRGPVVIAALGAAAAAAALTYRHLLRWRPGHTRCCEAAGVVPTAGGPPKLWFANRAFARLLRETAALPAGGWFARLRAAGLERPRPPMHGVSDDAPACAGCGELLAGHERCQKCGAPARGAAYRERVAVDAALPIPPVCACCLADADDDVDLRRLGSWFALPACRRCARASAAARTVALAVWGVGLAAVALVAGIALPFAVACAVTAAGAAVLALLAWAFARSLGRRAGHVRGCRAGRLRGARGRIVELELGNRAYARWVAAVAAVDGEARPVTPVAPLRLAAATGGAAPAR